MIPKIVHFVWVGPRAFPSSAREQTRKWRELMPDWRFMLWDESNIDFSCRFARQAYVVGAYNRVANFARVDALLKHGGVYLDHDIELVRPLDPLLSDQAFAGFQTMDASETDLVNNAVLASAPGHSLMAELHRALASRNGLDDVSSATGPGLLSALLRSHGPLVPSTTPVLFHNIRLYPPRYFYPYSWRETFTPEVITPETFAIHRWAHTWGGKKPPYVRLARKVGRLAAAVNDNAALAFARGVNGLRRGTVNADILA